MVDLLQLPMKSSYTTVGASSSRSLWAPVWHRAVISVREDVTEGEVGA